MRFAVKASLAGFFCSFCLSAQQVDLNVVRRIKIEAFNHSKVMDQLTYLADVYGPRLTASPEFDQAADWAVGRLKEYGLTNVHTEKWGPFGRSWSLEGYNLDMISPRYQHLIAAPLAWSGTTEGTQTAEVLYAPIEGLSNFFDVNKNLDALHKYEEKWKGKLHGKIVLANEAKTPKPSTKPLFQRYTDAELAEIAQAPLPSIEQNIAVKDIKVPEDREDAENFFNNLSNRMMDEFFDRYFEFAYESAKFFRSEGVVAVVHSDERAHNGMLAAEEAGSHQSKDPLAPPTFVVTAEQYLRLTHLVEKNDTPKLRVTLAAKISDHDVDGLNIIGELPGQTKPQEVVMIGAHFDSWHTATGATDNGAGSAVMIEVMRILKACNLKLNRTVRIGLWSGEEQGLFGSKAYVKAHFGDPDNMQLTPEHAKLDAYLNLDNGSGKIRGVYLQENDAARPMFETMFAPFHDLGVSTITLKNTSGTDHLSFDAVGLPGFQFIQDPLDYDTLTHHSDVDTYSHVIPEDMMQASAVIASLVYDLANGDEMMPRKPLPLVK